MKNLISTLLILLLLSACDNELKVISRDFSVSLKAIDSNTGTVGKAIKCTFAVGHLDANNDDQLFTSFEVKDGNGFIVIDDKEYQPGEAFEYDYKATDKLLFDFIPSTEGTPMLVMSVSSEVAIRSDSLVCKVGDTDIDVSFSGVQTYVAQYKETQFYLLLTTKLYDVKTTARFVKGSGRIYVNGYDALRSEGVSLEKNNLVTLTPETLGQIIVEFTVSSRYGLPVKKQITMTVNAN